MTEQGCTCSANTRIRLGLYAAIATIREEIEQHGPVLTVECLADPESMTEAEQLVTALRHIMDGRENGALKELIEAASDLSANVEHFDIFRQRQEEPAPHHWDILIGSACDVRAAIAKAEGTE